MHYGNKKCVHCNQPATNKITKIKDGQIHDIYLCADHAAESSHYQKQHAGATHLSEILKQLIQQDLNAKAEAGGPQAPLDLRCATCGLGFREYKKNLMLGCSD